MAQVTLENLSKRYGKVVALQGLQLQIADRELLCLLGPSGCGKSTALQIVAGIERPSSGRVRIGDRDVTDTEPNQRDVAMVFQSYALYPHKTVFENLAFPLRVRRRPEAEIRERVAAMATRLGIDGLVERKPAELSGGQRQRVALGRALVRQPQVFLLDEPLSNLDAQLRSDMRAELKKLHAEFRTTTIYVTHDQVEAMTLADRMAVLKDGKLQQIGPPLEIYRRPANRFVATFVGNPGMNFLRAEVGAGAVTSAGPVLELEEGWRRRWPALEPAPGPVLLGVRPEHVRLHPPEAAGEGKAALGLVESVEPLGSEILVRVTAGAERLTVRADPGSTARVNAPVGFSFTRGEVLLFDAESGRRLGLDPL